MKYTVHSIECVNWLHKELIITLRIEPGWVSRLFLRKPFGVYRKYRGDCTVWFSYPSGQRVGSSLERTLANIWQKWCWEHEDEIKEKQYK